jgi:very-short-patch-repair endonuclease
MPGYTTETLRRAKAMRRTPTPAEAALWNIVRGGRIGPRFRRQQPLGPFVADFLCAAHALVVEVDGAQHTDDPAVDVRRTRWLEGRGYRVIRFDNRQVLRDPESVIRTIMQAISRPHPGASRHPSPLKGEGV